MKKSATTAVDEHSIVRKSNQLNEALSKLSIPDHRLLAILISSINPMDEDLKLHTFTARQLAELCDIQERDNYKAIRKTVSGLIHKSVVILEDDGGWHEYPWLYQGVYYPKKGLISMQIHPSLKPYVLQLQSKYVQYDLLDVLQLKSKYSFRLFELLKQYTKLGERKFEVVELRNLLGVDKEDFKLFANLKQRVIEPAIKEVNGKTSILIEAEYIKTGRAFSHLVFKIQEKSQILDIKEIIEPADQNGIEELLNLIPDSVKRSQATRNRLNKALKKYEFEYIKETILYTNTQEIKKSYINLLGVNLDNNYAEEWIEKKKLGEERRKQQENEAAQRDRSDIDGWIEILKEKPSEDLEKIAAEIVRNKKKALAAQAILNERAQTKLWA